jgi:hypothetical protein
MLAAKLEVGERPVAECSPKPTLGGNIVFVEGPGALGFLVAGCH